MNAGASSLARPLSVLPFALDLQFIAVIIEGDREYCPVVEHCGHITHTLCYTNKVTIIPYNKDEREREGGRES